MALFALQSNNIHKTFARVNIVDDIWDALILKIVRRDKTQIPQQLVSNYITFE